jgi:hypothetical protein
MRGFN